MTSSRHLKFWPYKNEKTYVHISSFFAACNLWNRCFGLVYFAIPLYMYIHLFECLGGCIPLTSWCTSISNTEHSPTLAVPSWEFVAFQTKPSFKNRVNHGRNRTICPDPLRLLVKVTIPNKKKYPMWVESKSDTSFLPGCAFWNVGVLKPSRWKWTPKHLQTFQAFDLLSKYLLQWQVTMVWAKLDGPR